MILFFIGFLFIFLDFNYIIGEATVNLIPDFVGYILVFLGSRGTIGRQSNHFILVRIVSLLLMAWSAVAFVMGIVSFEMHYIVRVIVDIVVLLCALYMTYEFTEGIKTYERSIARPIGAAQLSSAWVLLCMGNLIYYFTFFFESLYLVCILLLVLSLIWFEYSVLYIYRELRKIKRK